MPGQQGGIKLGAETRCGSLVTKIILRQFINQRLIWLNTSETQAKGPIEVHPRCKGLGCGCSADALPISVCTICMNMKSFFTMTLFAIALIAGTNAAALEPMDLCWRVCFPKKPSCPSGTYPNKLGDCWSLQFKCPWGSKASELEQFLQTSISDSSNVNGYNKQNA